MSDGVHVCSFLGRSDYTSIVYEADDFRTSEEVYYVQTATAKYQESQGRTIESYTIFGTEESRHLFDASDGDDTLVDVFDERYEGQPRLREEFRELDLSVVPEFRRVPETFRREDMLEMFETFRDTLPSGDVDIVFDLTHGFRAQPSLGLLALNYLNSVEPDFDIVDLLYGSFESRFEDENGTMVAPLVSLHELWRLNDWASAFRVFETTGAIRPLASLASSQQDEDFKTGRAENRAEIPKLSNISDRLEDIHGSLETNDVPSLFGSEEDDGDITRLLRSLEEKWDQPTDEVGRFLRPFRDELLEELEPMRTSTWRGREGLKAQLALMRWLHQYGRYQSVLTLAREWLVTLLWELCREGNNDIESRGDADDLYGLLIHTQEQLAQDLEVSARGRAYLDVLGEEVAKVADQIAEKRNAVNHGCISENSDSKAPGNLEHLIPSYLERLEEVLVETWRRRPLDVSVSESHRSGETLFTALGTSPGVLYTAILHHEPDTVAVLTSKSGRDVLDRAKGALAEEGIDVEAMTFDVRAVDEPFAGFREARDAAFDLKETSFGESNTVNLAGGTTALQYGMQSLAVELGDAETGAVVDRRSSSEQREHPFVRGEWVPLEH